jgi:hypothetical protein
MYFMELLLIVLNFFVLFYFVYFILFYLFFALRMRGTLEVMISCTLWMIMREPVIERKNETSRKEVRKWRWRNMPLGYGHKNVRLVISKHGRASTQL